MKKVSFYTLGCRLNQSETAVVERTFEAEGYEVVDFKQPADMVVINTCTVTENGDADTRRLVHKAGRINPKTRIALIGCQAQTQKKQLAKLPNVSWIVGNARKMDLVSIVKDLDSKEKPVVITPTIPKDSFTIPVAGIDRKHTRANLKIQDGCDFFCSFCEIPYARGRARSREFNDILLEAKTLVAAGHKELVLTGINIATYKHNNKTILDIINALEQIDGLERIRISSIEPTTIPLEIIKKMAGQTKLCRYLHIPLQSGCDSILKLMKRKYSTREFSDFIHTVYETVPQVCIGTDIIVGFPGEEEAEFEQTLNFINRLPIHYFHVFSYSRRTMAKSQNLLKEVVPNVIQQRSKILRKLSQKKRRNYYSSLIGTTQKVLIEQKKENYWTGLTDNYVRVNLKSFKALTNQFLNIKINSVDQNNLVLSQIINH